MPNKAYAIIHDGASLLVARGGKSGSTPVQRSGNHLPGGTVPQNTSPWQQVAQEVAEETGFAVTVNPNTSNFTIAKPPSTTLRFFVIQVGSVAALVQQFHRPNVVDPHDEPFESVHAIAIDACLAPGFFKAQDFTDWFKDGLQRAQELHLL